MTWFGLCVFRFVMFVFDQLVLLLIFLGILSHRIWCYVWHSFSDTVFGGVSHRLFWLCVSGLLWRSETDCVIFFCWFVVKFCVTNCWSFCMALWDRMLFCFDHLFWCVLSQNDSKTRQSKINQVCETLPYSVCHTLNEFMVKACWHQTDCDVIWLRGQI